MGTRPELLRNLGDSPNVTDVSLELNYRSGQHIVDASLQALQETRRVRAASEGGEILFEGPTDGPEAQRVRAVELVRAAEQEGIAYDQIIVLSQGMTSAITSSTRSEPQRFLSLHGLTSSTDPRR